MNDLIRVGVVSSVNKEKCTAKVIFEDRDGAVSHDLKIVVPQTMKTKYYWLPDVNEQVLCLFLQNGQETGFIIGSLYSEADKTPVQNENKSGIWYNDGTYIEYDTNTSELTIKATKPLKINGDVIVNGDVIANGVSLVNHNHNCPDGSTSKPLT